MEGYNERITKHMMLITLITRQQAVDYYLRIWRMSQFWRDREHRNRFCYCNVTSTYWRIFAQTPMPSVEYTCIRYGIWPLRIWADNMGFPDRSFAALNIERSTLFTKNLAKFEQGNLGLKKTEIEIPEGIAVSQGMTEGVLLWAVSCKNNSW